MSIKFLVLGGGIFGFGGGGECRFYFYGRADSSDKPPFAEPLFRFPHDTLSTSVNLILNLIYISIYNIFFVGNLSSDSVKRHLSRRHLSALNLKFDFISDGGCTREEQIALSLKRRLFPHGGQRAQGFLDLFFDAAPHLEYFSKF